MTYRVQLDAFQGPLDLLLYLVKQHEVDVLDIRIGALAEQFLEYLKVIEKLDVEVAGDFLVMAATLMEIKSRSLIPVEPEAERESGPDPRRELVKQLLEYRRFKDAAAKLEEAAESQALRFPRIALPEPMRPDFPNVPNVELWDLVGAFARILRQTQSIAPISVIVDETPQHVYEDQIRAALRQNPRLSFEELFTPPFYRARLVGLFLAALELIRRFEIWLEQPEPFGPIWLSLPK